MPVTSLSAGDADLATAVLCDAFFDYPVMRFVLGATGRYPQRLRALIGFFVAARVLREDAMLGVVDDSGDLAAVALVTLPADHPPPATLADRREAVWRELGATERARYDAFGRATHQFGIQAPHHHLNMIGVRTSHLGRGHARTLLEHVHRLAEEDSDSAGVTLSTETQSNVPLYQHFGYRQLGYVEIGPTLASWAFYRSKSGVSASRPT